MKRILIALAIVLCAGQAFAQQVFRPLTAYSISISTTAVTAAQTFSAQTRIARVLCTVTCTVAFPVSPAVIAVTVPISLAPNEKEYFRVTPGATIAVVATSAGSIHIAEME